MTKIHATTENNYDYDGNVILDNCKFILTGGKLTIHGKSLKLLHNSSLEAEENAEIVFKEGKN